jgi:dsDNA-specific endonuclease/ATPase MutS2
MMRQLLIQSGELRQEMGELRQELRQEMRQIFDEKLNIGENQSVDLRKMERQLDNLYSVAPDAVLRTSRPTLVGRGGIAWQAPTLSDYLNKR